METITYYTNKDVQISFIFNEKILKKMEKYKSGHNHHTAGFITMVVIICIILTAAQIFLDRTNAIQLPVDLIHISVLIMLSGIAIALLLKRRTIAENPDIEDIRILKMMFEKKPENNLLFVLDYTQNVIRIQFTNKNGQYKALKLNYTAEKICKDDKIAIEIGERTDIILPEVLVKRIENDNLDGATFRLGKIDI